jgi:2-isopropylmalate synthase
MARKITIFDTTLRDGEQSPGANMDTTAKMQLGRQLARLNVDVIEAGFPISSPEDFEAVSLIAEEVKGPTIAGLARALPKDIESCWEAVKHADKPRIHTFIGTSKVHVERRFKKTEAEVLAMAVAAVELACSLCPDVEFSAEDAMRTRLEYLRDVVEATIAAGARTINVPDTVGYATPWQISDTIKYLFDNVPNIGDAVISVHCHDDLGMSVANSLMSVRAGAGQVECTINGLGERAGNASLEEIVMAIRTRADEFDAYTDIKTTEIMNTSRMVSTLTGFVVQPNKAIVGANAFAHEAGIHQHGMIQDRQTYEIMLPEDVGLSDSVFTLGPRKRQVYDADLHVIMRQASRVEASDIYHLEELKTETATNQEPSAEVTLSRSGETVTESASGNGPVNSIYLAISAATGVDVELYNYTIRSVTRGKDALGEVTVHIKRGEDEMVAKAASVDVLEASALAYLNAINALLLAEQQGTS